jgi:uncharacterized protein YbbC (DUF1343 family)
MKKNYTTLAKIGIFLGLTWVLNACQAQTIAHLNPLNLSNSTELYASTAKTPLAMQIGAACMPDYLPQLQGKKVALVVNHTALLGKTHLVDTLLSAGIEIKKVFAPEHGFRGDADAGELLQNSTDAKTGLPIVSLYGKNKKPTPEQLADIEIVIFDIQDVGVRFYTYISTMHYVMEACAENDKKLIIFDRPNPNGSYIDGPIREYKYKSFVGMHPIPIVHGLTIGELAQMINGERWLKNQLQCKLEIIKNKNYRRQDSYGVSVGPSPNLPNDLSIQLYPSLCMFEGTSVSIGRGTTFPFQVIGAPDKVFGSFSFTPQSIVGMSKNPLHKDQVCYGIDLRQSGFKGHFTLKYLLDFYQKSSNKSKFFNKYFDTLAGTAKLREQIQAGMSEKEIRASWEKDLQAFRLKSQKYLLYP